MDTQAVNLLGGGRAGPGAQNRALDAVLEWSLLSFVSLPGQGHDHWLGSLFTVLNWPRGPAEAENQPLLCLPCCAPWRRGAFWVPGGLGASPIWTGDLALLLVSKLFSLLEPQISHPSNGVIASRQW